MQNGVKEAAEDNGGGGGDPQIISEFWNSFYEDMGSA